MIWDEDPETLEKTDGSSDTQKMPQAIRAFFPEMLHGKPPQLAAIIMIAARLNCARSGAIRVEGLSGVFMRRFAGWLLLEIWHFYQHLTISHAFTYHKYAM